MYIRKHEFSKRDLTLTTHKDGRLFTLNKKDLVLDFAERQKDGYYKKVETSVSLALRNF